MFNTATCNYKLHVLNTDRTTVTWWLKFACGFMWLMTNNVIAVYIYILVYSVCVSIKAGY